MSKVMYCWRVKKDVPMLSDDEWEVLHPYLIESLKEIKRHREANGSTIEQARAAGFGKAAIDCYFKLTGYIETNPDNLWRYRASDYGDLCKNCKKPLRTPKAKICAECGSPAPNPSFKRDA